MSRTRTHDGERVGSGEPGRYWNGASDLSVRRRQPELMDDPALDRARHEEALTALKRINRVSLASAAVWREIRALHAAAVPSPIRILDVACGGGDVLIDVGRRARRARIAVTLDGCDVSDVARAATRRAAGEAGLPVHVFDADVVRGALTQDGSEGAYDLVTTSLFLHHLDWPQGVRLLREMARTARRTVLVQDLRRTRLGYGLAWLGLHTLTRSQVARVDGLRSVQGALRLAEVREMCTEAGLDGAIIERRWPQRFTVVWRRT